MFCPKCGSQMPDGVRFCQSCGTPLASEPAPAPIPTPEPGYGPGPGPAPGPASAGMQYRPASASIISVFTKPVTAGREFIRTGNPIMGILFVAIEGALAGAFGVLCESRFVNWIIDTIIQISTMMNPYMASDPARIMEMKLEAKMAMETQMGFNGNHYPGAFFATFALTFLVFAGVVLVTVMLNKAFGNNLTGGQIVNNASIFSVLLCPMSAIAIVVAFINPIAGMVVFSWGTILGSLGLVVVTPAVTQKAKNRKVLMGFLAFVIISVITMLTMLIGYKAYIPETIRMYMDMAGSGMGMYY